MNVGQIPVECWGAALAQPAQLPARWLRTAGDRDDEPTDFEVACTTHLMNHELHRAEGHELAMLTECWTVEQIPPAALEASARGESMVPWCPGLSWFWPTEMMGKPSVRDPRARQ